MFRCVRTLHKGQTCLSAFCRVHTHTRRDHDEQGHAAAVADVCRPEHDLHAHDGSGLSHRVRRGRIGDRRYGSGWTKGDFSRLLTILANFFPDNKSKALSLLERSKTSFERWTRFMKDFPSAQADLQGLFTSLLASLRRLSRADDTFWWWTKFFKEWVPDNQGDIDAVANLWELDRHHA